MKEEEKLPYYWIIASFKDCLTVNEQYLYIFPSQEEVLNEQLKTSLTFERILLLKEPEIENVIKKNIHLINENELNNKNYNKRYCFQFQKYKNGIEIKVFSSYLQSTKDVENISTCIEYIKNNTGLLTNVLYDENNDKFSYVFIDYNKQIKTVSENEMLERIRQLYNLYPLSDNRKIKIFLSHDDYHVKEEE